MKFNRINKIICFLLCFFLLFEQSGFAQIAGQIDISSRLAIFRNSLHSDTFRPLHLRSLGYDGVNSSFKLLLDKGDFFKSGKIKAKSAKIEAQNGLEKETQKLLNYFLIGLSFPNSSFWVNLRPDSPNDTMDLELARTDIGKVLLETDLELKKDTALATSPATPQGKNYWDRLYKKAGELFGAQENITIPTLVRPWIVPDEIVISETPHNAYIYKANLKVLLEEDYLETRNQRPEYRNQNKSKDKNQEQKLKELNVYSSELLRELILPDLTQKINSDKKYAGLRQVYYSLILAQWFKQRYGAESIVDPDASVGIYSPLSIDKNKGIIKLIGSKNLTNLISKKPWSKADYFEQYQQSFKQGEYHLQESVSTAYGRSIRTYTSGGTALGSCVPVLSGNVSSGINNIPSENGKFILISSPAEEAGKGFNSNYLISAESDINTGKIRVSSGVDWYIGLLNQEIDKKLALEILSTPEEKERLGEYWKHIGRWVEVKGRFIQYPRIPGRLMGIYRESARGEDFLELGIWNEDTDPYDTRIYFDRVTSFKVVTDLSFEQKKKLREQDCHDVWKQRSEYEVKEYISLLRGDFKLRPEELERLKGYMEYIGQWVEVCSGGDSIVAGIFRNIELGRGGQVELTIIEDDGKIVTFSFRDIKTLKPALDPLTQSEEPHQQKGTSLSDKQSSISAGQILVQPKEESQQKKEENESIIPEEELEAVKVLEQDIIKRWLEITSRSSFLATLPAFKEYFQETCSGYEIKGFKEGFEQGLENDWRIMVVVFNKEKGLALIFPCSSGNWHSSKILQECFEVYEQGTYFIRSIRSLAIVKETNGQWQIIKKGEISLKASSSLASDKGGIEISVSSALEDGKEPEEESLKKQKAAEEDLIQYSKKIKEYVSRYEKNTQKFNKAATIESYQQIMAEKGKIIGDMDGDTDNLCNEIDIIEVHKNNFKAFLDAWIRVILSDIQSQEEAEKNLEDLMLLILVTFPVRQEAEPLLKLLKDAVKEHIEKKLRGKIEEESKPVIIVPAAAQQEEEQKISEQAEPVKVDVKKPEVKKGNEQLLSSRVRALIISAEEKIRRVAQRLALERFNRRMQEKGFFRFFAKFFIRFQRLALLKKYSDELEKELTNAVKDWEHNQIQAQELLAEFGRKFTKPASAYEFLDTLSNIADGIQLQENLNINPAVQALKNLSPKDPQIVNDIKQLVIDYITGRVASDFAFNQKLAPILRRLGQDLNIRGALGSNLLNSAKGLKADYERGALLDGQLNPQDLPLDIQYSQAQEVDVRQQMVEGRWNRFVAGVINTLQRIPVVGSLTSPTPVGIGVGIASNAAALSLIIAAQKSMLSLSLLFPAFAGATLLAAVGTATAIAIISGFRQNTEVWQNMGLADLRHALNSTTAIATKLEQKLTSVLVKKVDVQVVIKELDNPGTAVDRRKALIGEVLEALSLGPKEQIELFRYANNIDEEKQKAELLHKVGKQIAILGLDDNAITQLRASARVDLQNRITASRKAFRKVKRGEVIFAVGISAGVAFVSAVTLGFLFRSLSKWLSGGGKEAVIGSVSPAKATSKTVSYTLEEFLTKNSAQIDSGQLQAVLKNAGVAYPEEAIARLFPGGKVSIPELIRQLTYASAKEQKISVAIEQYLEKLYSIDIAFSNWTKAEFIRTLWSAPGLKEQLETKGINFTQFTQEFEKSMANTSQGRWALFDTLRSILKSNRLAKEAETVILETITKTPQLRLNLEEVLRQNAFLRSPEAVRRFFEGGAG